MEKLTGEDYEWTTIRALGWAERVLMRVGNRSFVGSPLSMFHSAPAAKNLMTPCP